MNLRTFLVFIGRFKRECTHQSALFPRRDQRSRWNAGGEGYEERGHDPCHVNDIFATLDRHSGKAAAARAVVAAVMLGAVPGAIPAPLAIADAGFAVRTVAISDQPGPGSGAVDGREDGVFRSGTGALEVPFKAPIITDEGFIAFEGAVRYGTQIIGKPDTRGGIWVWNPATGDLRLVMISGMAAPSGGTFTGSFSELRIGQDATVLFHALLGEGAPSATVLFGASPTSDFSAIVRQGMPAPGGGTFGDIRQGASFINQGHIFISEFTERPVGDPPVLVAQRGAWQFFSGTLHAVAVPEMEVPGMPGARFTFARTEALGGDGNAILFALVNDAGTTRQSVWYGDADGLRKVAVVGDPAPGYSEFVPLSYDGLSAASTCNSGHIALTGHARSSLNPFLPAIWGGTVDDLRLIARRDEVAVNPRFPGDRFEAFSRPSVNGQGQVAFSATTSGAREGIWIARPNENGFDLNNVVIRGQPVAGPEFEAGVTFNEFNGGFSFNSLGQIAFLATLSGTGITTANNLSLWLYDPVKNPGQRLMLIAQKGSPTPVEDGERLVTNIQFTAGGAGQDGKATGLSDSGMMAYMLSFENGSHGLFVIVAETPPMDPRPFFTTDTGIEDGLFQTTITTSVPGLYAVECATALGNEWTREAVFVGGAPFRFTTSVLENAAMFVRVGTIPATSKENRIFLQGTMPPGFGANGFFQVDLDGDGLVDTSVRAQDGQFKLWVDTSDVPNNGQFGLRYSSENGTVVGSWGMTTVVKSPGPNTATTVPMSPQGFDNIGICVSCTGCFEDSSAALFNTTATPISGGVYLANGNLEIPIPVLNFASLACSAGFNLVHGTGHSYGGAFGQNMSFSGDLRIQDTGDGTAILWTGNNRPLPMFSTEGVNFTFANVAGATATYSAAGQEYTVNTVNGATYCIAAPLPGQVGHLVSISDANGNKTSLSRDECGNLTGILTPNGRPIRLAYSENPHLESITDPVGRTWMFAYDDSKRLIEIVSPPAEFADIEPGTLLTDATLDLETKSRRTIFAYENPSFPNYITSITDARGVVVRSVVYDSQGRVSTQTINGNTTQYYYEPTANPAPLPKLHPENLLTRIIDPEGNIVDTEIVGRGRPGRFGIHRRVVWTESGKGNAPLRDGEPLYYEQRWLQDCDCLTPAVVTQPFSSEDGAFLDFDENGIPQNWPRTIYTYNMHRQPVAEVYSDGVETVRFEMTYQPEAFGVNNQFSKMLTRTEARAFDNNPVYGGLNFVHAYEYDARGNMTKHISPTVTRGVASPQAVAETWTYNERGQVLTHTDPNGNVTVNTYHSGPPFGGNVNSKGAFFGQLASTTRGAAGSADPAASLTDTYLVNALGQVTRRIDPMGRAYDTEYNNLGELVRELSPEVTLRNRMRVRYESRYVYDAAGNRVMTRRRNIDFDGSIAANEFVDRSMSYDEGNQLLAERVEVDGNDLIIRFAYDANDRQIAVQQPEGNRRFIVYDERGLPFKQFTGVAPGASVTDEYPNDKRAVTLGGAPFVALTRADYDSRGNPVTTYDARGHTVSRGYDFRNRQIFEADQNRNGWVRLYDAIGNVLATEFGPMPGGDGLLTDVLARSYARYDELGRQYQTVLDIDLLTSELDLVDPAGFDDSSFVTHFDAGSRTIASFDANGNPTAFTYDAANRRLTITDALNNSIIHAYNPNSSVTSISETEAAGPDAVGAGEAYVTTFDYDELNRRIATRVRGLNGNSIDHVTHFAYDSRGNTRLVEDAEGGVHLSTYDDLSRAIRSQRFDRDPALGGAVELQRSEFAFDGNSRKLLDRAYSQVSNPASAQDTRYAYDDADRRIRTVYPDSDDPIDGSGNGPDGIYDRVEAIFDASSNPITVTEQRGVVFNSTFDPGNRLTDQVITLPPGFPGADRQQFVHDPLNRLISARNNYARVDRFYDPLSRMTTETQSIRLDGSGFMNGWEQPVNVFCDFDRQSNSTGCAVTEGTNTNLTVSRTFDALNRVDTISAAYLNVANHLVADYNYFGPGRIQTKTLGNGAMQINTFDVKRRLAALEWVDTDDNLLVGFEYSPPNGSGYDKADNVLYERWLHDGGRYDHFRYNKRYELTGVEYRSESAAPPAVFGDMFNYDDNYNRASATFGDPFGLDAKTVDSTYQIGRANEYTLINRNGTARQPEHDRAGNTTKILTRPLTGEDPEVDVLADARYDAFNLLFDIVTVNGAQHYRYDPFRRRIAVIDSLASLQGSRRFIYHGWSDIEERVFDQGASSSSAPSTLERIYVHGVRLGENLLVAIDRDLDGQLGGDNLKNQRDITADQEYYFLYNRLGATTALIDADNPARILEYVRYAAFGEATVLASIDNDADGREDTPLDLSDNATIDPRRFSEEFANAHLFAGHRFDNRTGLLYLRNRYYEPRSGRFISRDPSGYRDGFNRYHYAGGNPVGVVDPLGLLSARIAVAGINAEGGLFEGWRRTVVTYEWLQNRPWGSFDPSPAGYGPAVSGTQFKPDWGLGLRIQNDRIERGADGSIYFTGATEVTPLAIEGVQNSPLIANDIQKDTQALWIRNDQPAKEAFISGTSFKDLPTGRCVECKVYDHIVQFESIGDKLKDYVVEQVTSRAFEYVPMGSVMGSLITPAVKENLSTSQQFGIGLKAVICANSRRYVGAFNLPTPRYEGQTRTGEGGRMNVHFYGAVSRIDDADPGGSSPPLADKNYWEASD